MMDFLLSIIDPSLWDVGSFVSYAIFGIGGSKSKQSSQQQSQASGSSTSSGISRQRLAFSDLFGQLYGEATAATTAFDREDQISSSIRDNANALFSGGTSFLQNLESGGEGADYLRSRITAEGTVDEQIGFLQEDLSRFFNEELLTGIRRSAVGSGTYGGSRQGVNEALAAREVAGQFARGVTDIRQRDLDARTAAAADLFGLESSAAATGLAGLTTVADVGERAALADLAPYEALAGILGDPTVVGESRTSSQSRDQSFSFGSSSGKSGGFNLGFG